MHSAADKTQLNLCILSPLKNAYSETFIKNHLLYLPFNKIVLNGAELDQLSYNDQPLFPPTLANRLRRKLAGKPGSLETKRLYRFLKEKKIDIVLAEYGHIGTLIYRACADLGIPLVVHFHGNDASHKPTLQQLASEYREMFASAAAIVSVSRSMNERLLQLGARPGKLIYNCYGVDTTLFTPAATNEKPPVFVAVGRFVEKKAPHLTIEAFAKAREKFPSLKLVMVGDGPLLEACKQLVRAKNLIDAVEFKGILPPEAITGIVSNARAFVQHSVIAADGGAEGTPLAILEAGACGIPVISTRHEGIRDVIIENQTGLLVDEFDIAGMTRAMERFAADPAEAARMGINARTHIAENYPLTGHIEKLAEIITAAYDNRPQ